ncbi:14281_t:CDS:2 [Funneliformis mosseae]|uniref:14281_t:CDS:1 n=1 Tax=Funneliformis mosseae TaxID=27381 RepID=A0A9N9B7S2_FUNMO|nr:14281_t:CDS:2 [Funneliformis mosseae]
MSSPRYDTKSHVSHIAQSYTDVKGEQKHELNDKYVQPLKEPSPNLPFDQKLAIEKESHKQKADREIKEADEEVSINTFDHNEISKNILIGSFIGDQMSVISGWNQLRPLIEICKILVNRGYNVTLISPGKYSSPSSDYPIIHHISSGPSFDLSNIPEYREILSEEYSIKMFGSLKNYLNSKYLNDFNLYKKLANETIKVDLFFCDLFLNEACIDVAWLMNKPLVTMSSKLCK